MKEIETKTRYDYHKLFDAVIDRAKLRSETVGRDDFGNLILHVSETVNRSSACGTADEYFLLTAEEYRGYVEKARENRLISFLTYRKLLKETGGAAEEITSFEIVTLRESGMRGAVEYELLPKGDGAELTLYMLRYSGGKSERVPEERAACSGEEALELLNKCALLGWDGFDGPHPKGVLDGIMFTLKAEVNGGRKISAQGSENFPKHYRAFTDGLYAILRGEGKQ